MESFKNMDFRKLTLLVLGTIIMYSSWAQCDEVNQSQPIIIVVPWTVTDRGDPLHKYNNDINYRSILAVVEEAFIQRDFRLRQFREEYERIQTSGMIKQIKGAMSSPIDDIISNLNDLDVIIRVEIDTRQNQFGNQVRLQLTAVDRHTAEVLSILPFGSSYSNTVNTEKFGELAMQAIERKNEDGQSGIQYFLNTLQKEFVNSRKNGRTVEVSIAVDENTSIDLSAESEDYNSLIDLIEIWVDDNAYKGNYNLRTFTEYNASFSLKIPLRDGNCKNYSVSNFERDLRKQLNKMLSQVEDGKVARFKKATLIGNSIHLLMIPKEI